MDQQFEGELQHLKQEILRAGSLVEGMIARTIQALVEREAAVARDVIAQDPSVDQLQVEIDTFCLQLLALRQPTASDLRFITIGMRITTDLERIGDLAVNICEQVIHLQRDPLLKPSAVLPKMAMAAQEMLKRALDAFVHRDVSRAQGVCTTDDIVDRFCTEHYAEQVSGMQADPGTIEAGMRYILVALHCERVADHATNIAEEVIFMLQGKDIRHGRV
ncbi:MAG: phosphate signaling complex protein PhoU [Deltaproteobacteria bacterium]|nr:phosphate signaling complex protein PhoU [Deltaproteobacteria bacterium]